MEPPAATSRVDSHQQCQASLRDAGWRCEGFARPSISEDSLARRPPEPRRLPEFRFSAHRPSLLKR